MMDIDQDKVDQTVLALLLLGRHEGHRTWKAFDWEVMDRLHEKGYISDPVGKAKSDPMTFLLHTSRAIFPEILMGSGRKRWTQTLVLRSVAVVATCGEAWRTAWEDRVAAKILTCKLSWRLAQSRSSG